MNQATAHPRFAVFGDPIAQSKSPLIHAAFAKQFAIELEYNKQRVALADAATAIEQFFGAGGRGLNITAPLKLAAFEAAAITTQRAQNAGAANTLWRNDAGQLCADNTDGVGLVCDIVENLGWPLTGARVLLLGAGGAVRGVLQPLLEQQPERLVIANRTAAKAKDLAHEFTLYGEAEGCGFDQLTHSEGFDVIINGTSASLSGELPPIASSVLGDNSVCYDMAYGAEPTAFMRWAEHNGCHKRADGLGMLVGQAAESFAIWHGQHPATAPVIQTLRAGL